MTRRILLLLTPGLLLAGCARPVPPSTTAPPPTIVPVMPAPAPAAAPRKTPVAPASERCPSAIEIRRLRAARPKPLRTQPMPASPAERVARTSAQLGQYEARGAWADQVEDALARCDPS